MAKSDKAVERSVPFLILTAEAETVERTETRCKSLYLGEFEQKEIISMSDKKGEISDSALAMMKKAAEILEVHHAFTRGKIKEWESANGGAWDSSRFTERDMNMAFALALFSECRVSEAVSMLEEAGIEIEKVDVTKLN